MKNIVYDTENYRIIEQKLYYYIQEKKVRFKFWVTWHTIPNQSMQSGDQGAFSNFDSAYHHLKTSILP